MAAQVKVTFKQDLTEPVKIRHYEGVVFTGDDCGNLIKVALFDGGTPYSDGGTVSATAVLADGTTFPLTQGSITGNMVSVPLEAGALVVSGLMGLYVKISGGGIICTVLNAIFTVQVTDTGRVPAATVTTVNELVQEIKDAQDSFPADLTNLLAAVAPTFSTTTAYSAGAYVWQGGKLYRFTAAHPAGTWAGTDAAEAALGNDVADLKSAVNQLINQKTISASGSGNQYINYPIENGKTYRFSAQSASTVTIATVSSTNTTIENIGSIAPPSGYIDFTATSDAPKVLMYFRASGTGTISEKGLAISNINDEISAIKNRLTELDISVSSAGNNYFDYPVVSGKMYLVETSSSAVVSVATVTTGGTTIQNVGDFPATANARKVFKASSDASRILFYFRAAGIGSIKPVDEMTYLWANKVWSSYGDSISWLYGWQTIVNNNLLFANYVRNGKPGARISWLNATFGIDSNGIYTTGTAADTVHESLCAYDRIVKTIPEDIPLVFAMGGTNDFLSNIPLGDLAFNAASEIDAAWRTENPIGDYNISSFKGGLASMLMKLQYARPNALIVFGTLLNGIGAETGVNQYTEEVNTAGLKPSDYANAEKEVCAAFGVPVVDVFGTCGISVTNRATYLSDTVHPNGYGLNMLARCVTDGFKGIIPRY